MDTESNFAHILKTASCSSNHSFSVSVSSWPHLYHHVRLSRDQSEPKFINLGGRSSGFTLALCLLDLTLNTKEPNGLQPCQKKCTTQHTAARSYCTGKQAQKTASGVETPHLHVLCIAELLRCFLYFGSYLHWLSFSEASCLTSHRADRSWRWCERQLPIRNCHCQNDPSVCSHMCAQQQKSSLFFLFPFTNTWGKAFNNLAVSIIEAWACLK